MSGTDDRHGRFLARLDELIGGEGAPPPPGVEARIRRNVGDILRKMLRLYLAAVREGRGRPDLLGLDESLPPERRIDAAFERFADTLRRSWEEQEAKDERFGREEAARKERVKLDAHAEVMTLWAEGRREGA